MQSPRHITPADFAWVLDLNQRHTTELSSLTESCLEALVEVSAHARVIGECAAFLLVFDQDTAYDSGNFVWFTERYGQFLYVDRIVVSPEHRGRGHARTLYEDLFDFATRSGHSMIGCEVNVDPPNRGSEGFHRALGFTDVGTGTVNEKHVRYLARNLS